MPCGPFDKRREEDVEVGEDLFSRNLPLSNGDQFLNHRERGLQSCRRLGPWESSFKHGTEIVEELAWLQDPGISFVKVYAARDGRGGTWLVYSLQEVQSFKCHAGSSDKQSALAGRSLLF